MGSAAHPHSKVGFREFVALVAALMASQAIAIDAMLPALPTIGATLHVANPNHTQLIVTAYVIGMGLGQLFWGVFSDRYGRRPILITGLMVYVVAAVLSGLATSFVALLVLRFMHGVAAASVVIARSAVRDQFSGRQLARVMSLTMILFLMIPVIAPTLGQLVLAFAPWRSIFLLFGAYASIVFLWVLLRMPETLHPEYRLTLNRKQVTRAVSLVLGGRQSLCYTLAMAIMFGSILSYVGMVQQIFQDVFHRPALMPGVFALCASSMAVISFLNSRIVERFGMRVISQTGLFVFIGLTALHVLVIALGLERLWTFVLLQAVTMSCLGLTGSNFGAMALEPVGSVAGVAASLQGFISTTGGALVGALTGKWFSGSTMPLALGALLCGLSSLSLVIYAEHGRLFNPHHADPAQPGVAAETAG
jgi:DHA1 family bicyclomycin/chloramphenicol resistance-like MFS transporter